MITSVPVSMSALSLTVIGALAIGFVYLGTQVMGYLQPILVPFAVAGVLAYLLEPGVAWLERRGLKRQPSVLMVFLVFSLVLGGLVWWIAPKIGEQTANLAKKVPGYTMKARTAVLDFAGRIERDYGITLPHASAAPAPSTETPVTVTTTTPPATATTPLAALEEPMDAFEHR